jgi:2-desacetyl-2-hydroxyethyl bacteriochlorophyllide A dehydrogenase
MRAIMKTLPKPGIQVLEIPIPKIKPDEVLLKVKAAAICGSDLGIYDYSPAYGNMKLPVVLGHEFSGKISKIGNNVKGFKKGDRVLSRSVKECGKCEHCKNGMSNLCETSTLFGIHSNGGMAEYVAVPYRLLHHIPKEMNYEEAALVEPLSNAIHFVQDITPINPGDQVVVQGCGPIGLLAAQLFRFQGAKVIITGISIDSVRFEIAKRLGFTIINVDEINLVDHIMEITNGRGADISFLAVGAPSALIEAVHLVKKRGQITIIGIFNEEVSLPITKIVRREIVLKGAYDARPSNFPTSIKLIKEKSVIVEPIITHKYDLNDAQKGFQVAKEKSGGKVIFIP